MTDRTCERCGAEVVRVGKHGPWPSYCSRDCKVVQNREYARLRPSTYVPQNKPLREVECVVCGGTFLAKRVDVRYCSNNCGNRARAMVAQCLVPGCGRGLCAVGLCKPHYNKKLRAEGRINDQPWNDRRRNNAQARRARMKGAATGGSVFLADVVQRDGSLCGICREPVDLSLAWPHPRSRSVDHVIPLSRGGAHRPENCQLAHLNCNIVKSDKIA